MLLIKIEDATVESREIKGKNGTFSAKDQYGIADMPNGERRKVRIRVPREGGAYRVGVYTISDESFGVGQYGDIQVANLVLVPAPAAKPSAGATPPQARSA
jgi:hypothetical protein